MARTDTNSEKLNVPNITSNKTTSSKKTTANNIACWDSDGNINIVTQRLEEMFVELGQKTRIESGQHPAERPVFRKQH